MWDQRIEGGQQPGPAGTRATPRGRTPPERPDSAGGADGDEGETEMIEASAATLRLDALAEADAAYAALSVEEIGDERAPLTDAMRRARIRAMIREFLRAVPRSEPETMLRMPRLDGEMRVLTRAELTTAIDRLRPRMRQIVRLGIEERWPRQKVCSYLRGISMKTLERDQVEALDLLASL